MSWVLQSRTIKAGILYMSHISISSWVYDFADHANATQSTLIILNFLNCPNVSQGDAHEAFVSLIEGMLAKESAPVYEASRKNP